MYQTVICLVLPLPAGSSNLPGQCLRSPGSRRAADLSCSVLLRMGFTCAPHVTARAVVSYTAFAPLPAFAGGIFLLHWPGSRLHRTLSGILPCEARTFLSCGLSALAAAITCLTSKIIFYRFSVNIASLFQSYPHTWKQLPPINSRIREELVMSSVGTGMK